MAVDVTILTLSPNPWPPVGPVGGYATVNLLSDYKSPIPINYQFQVPIAAADGEKAAIKVVLDHVATLIEELEKGLADARAEHGTAT